MRVRKYSIAAVAAAILLCSGLVLAQDDSPPWSMVSIYHVAPGKHMEFLKWMQQQEAISKEAGVESSKWYSHVDGANWDFVVISPMTTEAQDKQIEKLTREKGHPTGFWPAVSGHDGQSYRHDGCRPGIRRRSGQGGIGVGKQVYGRRKLRSNPGCSGAFQIGGFRRSLEIEIPG